MNSTDSREGPTPNGGVRSTILYLDAENQPADKDDAVACEICEYDADGKVIMTTYGQFGKGKPDAEQDTPPVEPPDTAEP